MWFFWAWGFLLHSWHATTENRHSGILFGQRTVSLSLEYLKLADTVLVVEADDGVFIRCRSHLDIFGALHVGTMVRNFAYCRAEPCTCLISSL